MISAIVPVYLNTEKKKPLALDCVRSLKGADELILVFNGTYDEELASYATKVVWNKENLGFAKGANDGLRVARGDYLALVNDDTRMLNGSLADMCRTGCLVRPTLVKGYMAKFSFVVLDRAVVEKVGYLDEQFEVGYYEDDDYLRRCEEAGVPFVDLPFKVWHYGGASMEGLDKTAIEAKNKALFNAKWSV